MNHRDNTVVPVKSLIPNSLQAQLIPYAKTTYNTATQRQKSSTKT